MSVVDIHPHIVSPDVKRYPLAPLGGTQSTWSSERPTTYEMLLTEMDAAGVDKAAIVHSSTAYGYETATWRMLSPPFLRASAECIRSMLWRPVR